MERLQSRWHRDLIGPGTDNGLTIAVVQVCHDLLPGFDFRSHRDVAAPVPLTARPGLVRTCKRSAIDLTICQCRADQQTGSLRTVPPATQSPGASVHRHSGRSCRETQPTARGCRAPRSQRFSVYPSTDPLHWKSRLRCRYSFRRAWQPASAARLEPARWARWVIRSGIAPLREYGTALRCPTPSIRATLKPRQKKLPIISKERWKLDLSDLAAPTWPTFCSTSADFALDAP